MEEILKAKINELTELQYTLNNQINFARTPEEKQDIRKEAVKISHQRMEYRAELKQLQKQK
jgi:hypothetical protein